MIVAKKWMFLSCLWALTDCSNKPKQTSRDSIKPGESSSDLQWTPGDVSNIGGIFQLQELVVKEVSSSSAAVSYCQSAANLGHVYKLGTTDSVLYYSCLGGVELAEPNSQSTFYYKSFDAPSFGFTGFIFIEDNSTGKKTFTCGRYPEASSAKGDLDSSRLGDICGDLFAFKFSVADETKLGELEIQFAAGSGQKIPVIMGQFR